MTRIMYDSVTAADIPASATMVAGYVNGTYKWSAADWARFPGAVKVRIATQAYVNDGHVLDVEPGDATPAQAPGWVQMRRAAGVDPTVYCGASALATVQAAFNAAGVPQPHYWVAHYDNVRSLPAGTVAKQFTDPVASGGHYDLSIVADYWPGVDGNPSPTPVNNHTVNDEENMITAPAGTDEHINLIVKGKTELYLACSWNRSVQVAAILFYGDTGPDLNGTGVGGARENIKFLPNRPGPIAIPDGAAMCTIRYTADHSFAVGAI